jgi:hypothetical protein
MKAISLWEPWASAMALGVKQIETRSWPTKYRGELAICASVRKMGTDERWIFENLVMPNPGYEPKYGFCLCVVELYACVVTDNILRSGKEALLGNFAPGRYGWMTRNYRRLKTPYAITGQQGLWKLSAMDVANIEAEL